MEEFLEKILEELLENQKTQILQFYLVYLRFDPSLSFFFCSKWFSPSRIVLASFWQEQRYPFTHHSFH